MVRGTLPKHVDRFLDRHGKPRHYYRPVKHGPRLVLRGMPDSDEFERSYADAVRRYPALLAGFSTSRDAASFEEVSLAK